MTDYYAFWNAIVIWFGIVPAVVGGGLGALWAWRHGKHGAKLIIPSLIGGIGLCIAVMGGILLFLAF